MIPTFLSELVRAVVIMTITGGLLCLLLLVIKPVIRHHLPKLAQYYFWIVVLGTLLIPISRIVVLPGAVPNVAPIHNAVERNVISIHEETVRFLELADAPWQAYAATNNIAPENAVRTVRADFAPAELPLAGVPIVSTLFMLIYPFAVLFVLTYSLLGYARFVKKLRRGHIEPQYFELDMLGELAKGKRTPKLFKSSYAATPMLIGIFNPTIVLPDREYSNEQLYGILLHELTHMRRFDVAVKWLSLFACAVHWFNPLVWLAQREIDRACELACDEVVIRNMDAYKKQNYGETLIAIASTKKIPLPILSTTMCAEKRAIKERLTAIMKSKKHTKLAILTSILILFGVVLAACALGAASGASGNGNTDNNGTFIDQVAADGIRMFTLENVTDNQRRYQMWAVSLYSDGTATLFNAMVISFSIPPAPHNSFSIVGDELSIYSNYQAFEGMLMARFTIIDNNTLELVSAAPPLIAIEGTRFVFTPGGGDISAGLDGGIESIPHVGAAHETQRIVNAMPLPRSDMALRSIQIGADHGGFGYGAYTLTIHYGLHGGSFEDAPGAAFQRISVRLFALIENLQAITFSVVDNEETDIDNYIYRWSISRTSSEAGSGAVTSFRGMPASTGQIEAPVGTHERVDLRWLMLQEFEGVRHMMGTQTGSNDGVGMWDTYNFENGLNVSVNENGIITSIMLEYAGVSNPRHFHFAGIDGTSSYADVIAQFGNNPYTIRAGSDEARVGAVRAYGYFVDWHMFAYFFFDADNNVVAISFFPAEETTTPFVRAEIGALAVHGFGGRVYYQKGNAIDMPSIYFAGRRFPVAQLENETIEGGIIITQDSLRINLAVARNDIIIGQIDGPLGTLAGPWLEYEYLPGIGISEIVHHPFEFTNGHEPLHFEFAEENALALAQMMMQVLEVVDRHLNAP